MTEWQVRLCMVLMLVMGLGAGYGLAEWRHFERWCRRNRAQEDAPE